jgi:iron(III) transport system substrate-binding protein
MSRRRGAALVAGILITAVAVASTASTQASTGPPAGSSGNADAALAELVAAAEEEGSLTVYSSQNLGPFEALSDSFRDQYPDIGLDAVRMVDTEIIPRVDIELSTGAEGADLVIVASPDWVVPHAEAGSFLDASASPQIAGLGAYDADLYVHEGNYFEVGAALATFAWNTEEIPDGLTSYTDLLDPQYDGRIGVVDPAIASVVVDFWWWLEDTYGADYVPALAEQSPRIYPGAQPMIEAMSSGEIAIASYASTSVLAESIEAGAPIDYAIDETGAWGVRFYAFIPESADNPNAAALFADYMLTPEGQELVQVNAASVLPDVPGTLTTVDQTRVLDFAALTPEAVAEYNEEWNSLFR